MANDPMHSKKLRRSSAGLREALFDALERVQSGDMIAEDARAIVEVSRAICETVRLEVDVAKFVQASPERGAEIAPTFLPLIGADTVQDTGGEP